MGEGRQGQAARETPGGQESTGFPSLYAGGGMKELGEHEEG